MDFRIAKLFKESRENEKIRDEQHIMPTSQITDFDWKFEEIIAEIKPVTDPESIEPTATPCTPNTYVPLI